MKTLILGAHGFIGRHAARVFAAAGHEVHGLGHGHWPRHGEWGVASWVGDSLTFSSLENAVRGVEAIVNCVGGSTVGSSYRNPREDFGKNVLSQIELLEFVRLRAPAARVVTLSSAAVYGAMSGTSLHENEPLRPMSPYGVHKVMGEEACRSYATHFGLSIAAVRLFSVYGPGLRKQLLWDACGRIAESAPRFSGTGQEIRDWIFVTDAARLLLRVIETPFDGFRVINGGTGVGTTNQAILTLLSQSMGKDERIVFDGNVRPGDPKELVADPAVARDLGWLPTVTLRDGIAAYARWYIAGARDGD